MSLGCRRTDVELLGDLGVGQPAGCYWPATGRLSRSPARSHSSTETSTEKGGTSLPKMFWGEKATAGGTQLFPKRWVSRLRPRVRRQWLARWRMRSVFT
jgi:hypothetical protein